MAIVMTYDSPAWTDPGQYNYLAELRYGSDGDMFGPAEVMAGTPSSQSDARVTWDENPDDGIDSSPVTVGLSFQAGVSGLDWRVDGADDVTSNVAAFHGISEIDILAGVQGQTAMLWGGVSVAFYKGSVLTEKFTFGCLGENATTIPGGAAEEQVTRIVPTNSDNDRVVIKGQVLLVAPAGEYPDPDGMFSQVLIHTA